LLFPSDTTRTLTLFFFLNVSVCVTIIVPVWKKKKKQNKNLLVGCILWRNLRGTIRNRWGLERRPRAAERRRAGRVGSWGGWARLGIRTEPNWPRRKLCWAKRAQLVPFRSVPNWIDFPISFPICPKLNKKKNKTIIIIICFQFIFKFHLYKMKVEAKQKMQDHFRSGVVPSFKNSLF
jgi:hypothetical protein